MTLTIIFQNKESFTVPRIWVAHTRYSSKGTPFIMKCNPEYASIMEQDSVIMSHNQSDTHGTLIFNDVMHMVESMSDYIPTEIAVGVAIGKGKAISKDIGVI